MSSDLVRLFVYGSMLEGEREHALLAGATFAGVTRTAPAYTLVEVPPYAALLAEGSVSVLGELYVIDKKLRFMLDVKRQCPVLFHRITVRLEDGSEAEAYAMREEQVRGKRRIKHGSYRGRFSRSL
jgi:gamma-glutamylaminecyclotransferase